MKLVKAALFVAGILATLMGVVWMGQGSGYFPYPPNNFMINETPWIYRGLILALLGLAGIVVSRRV